MVSFCSKAMCLNVGFEVAAYIANGRTNENYDEKSPVKGMR